jgi:RHS repeat-associated protein
MAQGDSHARARSAFRSMQRWRRPRRVLVALVSTISVMAALVAGIPSPATAAPTAPPFANDPSIPVKAVSSHYEKSQRSPSWKPAVTSWPSGAADVSLATSSSAPATMATPQSAAKPVQAGKLPVWVAPATPPANAAHTATPASTVPATVHISVASRAATQAAGVTGTIVGAQRTDSATSADAVQVSVGYGSFLDAYGGEFATRLHLVTLPACALTTPDKPACRTQTPVPYTRDGKADQLTATLALPAATHAKTAAPTVLLAATSSTSGSGGDYSATSLKPEGSWQAGGATDSFTWSYPISTPNVPGGLQPKIGFSYDSQSADGLTSSTNDQASWLGDGWSYSPGFVERSFQSCGQNPAGPTHTGDNCWSTNNTLTLSLNGQSAQLIFDDTSKTWHPQADSDEQVTDVASSTVLNGAQNGEYFVVTTDNGTKYYFGRNQLPGYQSGSSDPTTNSVWTEPVYFTAPVDGQNCYNATFASSWCQEAYRWNLDYVVDTHSDVISYFYNTEANNYAADNGSTATASYIRGGYLAKIQYGQRDGHVYDTQPAAQVVFTSTGRCQTAPCDPSTISSSTASNWPDVPADLVCAYQAACDATSPSFWTGYTLQTIQTDALVGTTETPVDSWTLQHSFPATNDTTTPALWLDSIQHSGLDTTAGGSSSQIDLPTVTFKGENLTNRVNLRDGISPLTRQRLETITTETGETIQVDYSSPACGQGTPSDPSLNTTLCYPDYWASAVDSPPTIDWFNKFIVTEVTEVDPTDGGANDDIVTTYTPVGAPAWHRNDNPLTPSDQRTWDDWRGYPGMTVSTGSGTDPNTKTVYTYFRGMNGDAVTGGTRSVSVSDSRGDSTTDLPQYEGMTYETVVYNGSSIVTDTIDDPWTSAVTATHTVSGLPTEQAFMTGTADTRVYTPLANGSTRETETSNSFDSYGRVVQVNDQGDLSTTADDLCTTTTYNDNTAAWILDTPSDIKTVSANCTTTSPPISDIVSDGQTYYDNATDSTTPTAPTVGDPTEVRRLVSYTGSTPNWSSTSQTVDQYGRALTATNADGFTTRTTYTPATGAEPTATSVTDPLSHATSSTLDPLRDLTLTSTDAAGFVTKEQYDALGRLTAVTKPGISGASMKYSYTISNTGPSVVDTYTLNPDGSYRLAETLYDALLRARETQTQTPDNGRDITDVDYNTDGWESRSTDPYFNAGPVSTTYVEAQDGTVPSETGYTYDGAGRKTAAISYTNGTTTETPTWQTNYLYGGNYTTTVPPAGATASTTITDARGNTTDLIQYHTGVPTDPSDPATDYSDTHYTYTPAQKLATVTDAAGNAWSYGYDLLGEQTSASDPDAGTSSSVYDPAGQLTSVTDARGKQTSTTYDKDGRKTATYDTTGGAAETQATKLAAWTYDSVPILVSGKKAIGYPASTTSYNGGDTYTQTITNYNTSADVSKSTTTLTGEDAALVPSTGFTDQEVYSTTGYLTDDYQGAIDGLPNDDFQIAYADVTGATNFGEPTSFGSENLDQTGSNATIAYAVGYTELGQVAQYSLFGSPNDLYLNYAYDSQTQALTDIKVGETGQPGNTGTLDDLSYRYSGAGVSAGAGLVTATVDSQNAGATVDTQCFTYDYAQRLTQAWTATDSCAATPTTGNSATVGGPLPYWQSWSYDAAGDRATQTDHDPGGTTSNDTTTNYTYPAPASATDQPHTLTSTTATGPQAVQNTASFGYDADGNTTSVTTGANGAGDQTLTYNDQGKLASDVTVTGNTTYVYDASGNLLVRRDPGTTTLFLGNQQLTQNTATGALSGTRYYSANGQIIAARTGTDYPQILIPDRQGTDQVSLNPDNDTLTRRQYLPFGQTRGTTPTTWAGADTGYVGGTPDTTTSLENLGAREYDPTTGRFLTIDPTFEANDPTQMGGYDYAGNNPVTRDDPTGLHPADCGPTVDASGTSCLGGYENGVQAGQKASHDGTTAPSPQAAKARVETAAYESLQDEITKLEAALAQFKAQYKQHMEECSLGENKRVMPVDTSSCGYPKASWQDLTLLAGIVGGAAACLLPFVDVACGMLGEAELGGGVSAMGGLGVGAAAGGEAAIQLTDLIGADSKALDDAQAESNALAACGNSFIGSTPVLMADGTTKPISQVHVGDKITNSEPDSATTQLDTVTAVHITYTDRDYDQLTIATPTGPASITSTAEHLYWDATTHSWTQADNLHSGDQLDTPGNVHVTVTATRRYTAIRTTYNLTVNNVHTYYVEAGTTPVLVHNCGTGPDGLIDLQRASESGEAPDRGGYSLAGRALQKHAGRPGTGANWPTPPGTRNPQAWNTVGQDTLNEILTNPDSVAHLGYGRIGGAWQDTLDVRLPNGLGARFDLDGDFSGFLD